MFSKVLVANRGEIADVAAADGSSLASGGRDQQEKSPLTAYVPLVSGLFDW